MMMRQEKKILIPISPAELIDRISILEVRKKKMNDSVKLKNIEHELSLLRDVFAKNIVITDELERLMQRLEEVSLRGWETEDQKRDAERRKDFGDDFIEAARTAYLNNDERAAIKKEINMLLISDIIEEKSYEDY